MDETQWFAQSAFPCRLAWGWRGARAAATRGDIVVVVDTLRFSTAAAAACARGVTLWPVATQADADACLRTLPPGAVTGKAFISPQRLLFLAPGTQVALATPNGATCCHLARTAPRVFAGTIVSAGAVAEAVGAELEAGTATAVTVLACGERWSAADPDDGALRFALEDFLGAGAVLRGLPTRLSRSPEAQAAQATFQAFAPDLETILRTCGSGVELIDKGLADDLAYAARLDTVAIAPVLVDGVRLEPWVPGPSISSRPLTIPRTQEIESLP
jgi:2-phosphosulfolactate phosphatase